MAKRQSNCHRILHHVAVAQGNSPHSREPLGSRISFSDSGLPHFSLQAGPLGTDFRTDFPGEIRQSPTVTRSLPRRAQQLRSTPIATGWDDVPAACLLTCRRQIKTLPADLPYQLRQSLDFVRQVRHLVFRNSVVWIIPAIDIGPHQQIKTYPVLGR